MEFLSETQDSNFNFSISGNLFQLLFWKVSNNFQYLFANFQSKFFLKQNPLK